MGEGERRCSLALALSLCLRAQPAPGQITGPPGGTSLVVTAVAGATLSVQAWRTGGAWTLRVRDPSGREAASVSWRRYAVITLSWPALEEGRYTVDCEPAAHAGAACELEVIAGPGDGDGRPRMEVEAALRKGHELLQGWSPDACRRAEGEFGKRVRRAARSDWPTWRWMPFSAWRRPTSSRGGSRDLSPFSRKRSLEPTHRATGGVSFWLR